MADIVSRPVLSTDSLPLVTTGGLAGGDLVHGFQIPLSGKTTSATATYSLQDVAYDFALAGFPLLSKIDKDHPYQRGLAPIRKDQFDNQQIPGEQSLTGWWLRSQTTFIGGQGLLYQDPTQSKFGNEYGIRYGSSYGVNPWVDGQLTLLKRTRQDVSNGATKVIVRGYNQGLANRYWTAGGSTLTSTTISGINTNVVHGAAGILRDLTSSGYRYHVMGSDGIWSGTTDTPGAKIWNDPGASATGTMGVVKGRLMATFDASIYELNITGTGGPALPTATFTHQDPTYTWVGFAEGTDGIFAAGHDGTTGTIYKLALDSSGNIPVITAPSVNASLPFGELVNAIYTYLGSFIGICTSRGFRVGQIDGNGDIQYGPLIFEISGGCQTVTGYDRFFWVGATNSVNGKAGLYRVDLGAQIQTEGGIPSVRFAYATDLTTGTTGTVTSVTSLGTLNQRVIGVAGAGAFVEHATELESVGQLDTGRIRFNTLENKLFKFASIRCPQFLDGQITVTALDQTGGATSLSSFSGGTTPRQNDITITSPSGPQEWIALRFTLGRNATDATKGAVLNGWQLKGVPGVIRQRIIQMSFLMADFESDYGGKKTGYSGRTVDRLRDIEESIQTGEAVQFQDLRNNTSDLVFVEDMQFTQIVSPGKGPTIGADYGGILTVSMRTMNDQVTVT